MHVCEEIHWIDAIENGIFASFLLKKKSFDRMIWYAFAIQFLLEISGWKSIHYVAYIKINQTMNSIFVETLFIKSFQIFQSVRNILHMTSFWTFQGARDTCWIGFPYAVFHFVCLPTFFGSHELFSHTHTHVLLFDIRQSMENGVAAGRFWSIVLCEIWPHHTSTRTSAQKFQWTSECKCIHTKC